MAHGTPRKFASQVRLIREQLDEGPLAFSKSLSVELVQEAMSKVGIEYRERIYTPWVTLWAFLTQVMSEDHSCRHAVLQVLAYLSAQGRRVCSAATSTYCEARARLPELFFQYLVRRVGRQTMEDAPESWLFYGRPVKVVDGTTVTMPDTQANQEQYPQVCQQREGLGFPIARLVVIFSLSVGTALEAAIRPYQGKGTGELAMFHELSKTFEAGDIVLGDKGFCSYCHVASLVQGSVDVVTTLNRSRLPCFRRVKNFSKKDALYRWNKPKEKPQGFTAEEFGNLPDYLEVRIVTVVVKTPGFRPKRIEIVTTLVDPKLFPPSEIAELYRRRWMCELNLRDIKTTLQMDHLRCETPEMVRKEIFAHLLAYNVIRTRMAQAAFHLGLSPHSVSFKGTVRAIEAFRPHCNMCPLDNLAVMLATIGYHQVGKQPGRSEPRKIKRRPKYKPLTKPRAESRKEVAA